MIASPNYLFALRLSVLYSLLELCLPHREAVQRAVGSDVEFLQSSSGAYYSNYQSSASNGNGRSRHQSHPYANSQSSNPNSPPTQLAYHPNRAVVNRCYSCMSAIYEELFRQEEAHLSRFFHEPRNFTNACDEPMGDAANMGVVPCRAICLTLTQEFIVMGRKTGKRLTMRGCSTSLSRFGFYNRTLAMFDRYDMCREVLANELFRYDTDSQPIQVVPLCDPEFDPDCSPRCVIQVCSCLGDRCNGVSSSPAVRMALGMTGLTTLLGWALCALKSRWV